MTKKRKRTNHRANLEQDNRTSYDDTASYHHEQPTVDGAHRYNSYEDLPWDLQKYWRQRFDIFSLYNEGIWMTEDSWFEVTPESIANKITEHVTSAIPGNRSIIIDAFCGIGGNTIAFALSGKFKRVYAIEKNDAALACAKHNAEIYGVANKITWFQGDCFELLGVGEGATNNTVAALTQVIREFGVIFASPPWGGPSYKAAEVFDLSQMQPYALDEIYTKLKQVTKNMVLYLPRSSNLNQIAKCVEDTKKAQVVHYCTKGNSRALCVFYGDWKQLST